MRATQYAAPLIVFVTEGPPLHIFLSPPGNVTLPWLVPHTFYMATLKSTLNRRHHVH